MKIRLLLISLLLAVAVGASAQETPAGILFVGVKNESSDIYLWQPDGDSGLITPLTQTPQKEGNACWWTRKGLILASREMSENHYGLVALNDQLETVWQLEDPLGSLGWPVPSPWDDRILCVRALSNGFVQTGMMSFPDGGFEPFEFENLSGGQLAWLTPDRIMLSRVTATGFVITQRDLNTGVEEVVVSGGQNWQSHVNMTSGRMFFVRRVDQISSIFELCKDAQGSWEYENLTNSRTYDWQPATCSEGRTLIYQSLRGGRFVTIIRDLSSGAEKQIGLTGFVQIYHPTILDRSDVERLLPGNGSQK
ncbi:MAG: hypothetical protein KKB51_15185 [Candidatus Riflebacteria bacterium]|nr:hypothetical protein [Candidatus Riflebacteria bacterium]